MKRKLLEQRCVADCIELLRTNGACSAANVVLCDGSGAVADVEVRPEGIQLCDKPGPDARLHTNHYVCEAFRGFEHGDLRDSSPRLDRLTALVQSQWGRTTVDKHKGIVADPRAIPP